MAMKVKKLTLEEAIAVMTNNDPNTCYRCKKELTTEIKVDDAPYGILCIICEDVLYGKWMLPDLLEIDDECKITEH